jgi:tRNA-specific 2-thiouridylase
MNVMKKKVLIGLSGGVDSAVAAHLLLEQGYMVEGAFMHNWHDDTYSQCQASADFEVAVKVADFLKIKLHSIDFATEYFYEVFTPFLKSLQDGLTPNPDVFCNKNIKFKYLLQYAMKHEFDYIATGHYAKIVKKRQFYLYQAKDKNKDQTYFLHQLSQQQLAKTIFPLAEIEKKQVKIYAKNLGLPNFDRKESMGICFIGQNNFKNFIKPYLKTKKGNILTVSGEKVGTHEGLSFYTIGQRKGIGIGGSNKFLSHCWYVVNKKDNNLIISQDPKDPLLYSNKLLSESIHWISKPTNNKMFARIRHRQPLQECVVDGNIVTFAEKQRAITPGQFIVFYDNQVCLGGAMILENCCN